MGLFKQMGAKLVSINGRKLSVAAEALDAQGLLDVAAGGMGDSHWADEDKYRGAPVQWSEELDRVAAVPRRMLNVNDTAAAVAWTKHLRRERETPCDCVQRWGFCITDFKAIQGWMLEESSNAGGFLGPVGVGWGKEGACIHAPWAFESKHTVLLLPANLRSQLLTRDWPQWSAHFHTPSLAGGPFKEGRPVVYVMSYNDLSSIKASDLLKRCNPDLIICNEVHNLANPKATRTKRFLRYFNENPKTRLFAVSGTLSKKSLKDYAHIAELALKDRSPLPRYREWFHVVSEWAAAIDAVEYPAPMGQLRRLCARGETARSGFRRRLIETEGVVATEESALDILLTLTERKPAEAPAQIKEMLGGVRDSWQRPDGEELQDILERAKACREVACGFFYRWKFPRGEPKEVIDAWLKARREWHTEVREKLKRSKEQMDSPKLLERAADRWHFGYTAAVPVGEAGPDGEPPPTKKVKIAPKTKGGPLPVWDSEHYPLWKQLRHTVEYVPDAVWVDPYLAEDAAEWARKNTGIVWYEHRCFGQRVAAIAKIRNYGGGKAASDEIVSRFNTPAKESICASIRAHGTGKNLQRSFYANLVSNPPSDGAVWEQLLARTHRPGQFNDTVTAAVYRHTAEMRDAIDTAIGRARYIKETLGGDQKLLYATIDFEDFNQVGRKPTDYELAHTQELPCWGEHGLDETCEQCS